MIDELLGCLEKVRPKFVKQTRSLENKKSNESEHLDKEEAPRIYYRNFRPITRG